jgi:hypothetical protein
MLSAEEFFKEVFGVEYAEIIKNMDVLSKFLSSEWGCGTCALDSERCKESYVSYELCSDRIKDWLNSEVSDELTSEQAIGILRQLITNSDLDDNDKCVSALKYAIDSIKTNDKLKLWVKSLTDGDGELK